MGDGSRYFVNIFSHSPISLVCVNFSHREGYEYKIGALFFFFYDGTEMRGDTEKTRKDKIQMVEREQQG